MSIDHKKLLTTAEVEAELRQEGLLPGTCDFWNERYRRFHPTGAGSNEWIRTEDRDRAFRIDVV